MTQPLFPSTIGAQPRYVRYLTTKNLGKTQEDDGETGSPCLDKPALAQGGGGGRTYSCCFSPVDMGICCCCSGLGGGRGAAQQMVRQVQQMVAGRVGGCSGRALEAFS